MRECVPQHCFSFLQSCALKWTTEAPSRIACVASFVMLYWAQKTHADLTSCRFHRVNKRDALCSPKKIRLDVPPVTKSLMPPDLAYYETCEKVRPLSIYGRCHNLQTDFYLETNSSPVWHFELFPAASTRILATGTCISRPRIELVGHAQKRNRRYVAAALSLLA